MTRRGGWQTLAAGAALWLLAAAGTAHAQRSTEQFIPIGQSPGVSQKQTAICTVESMNLRDGVLTASESGVRRLIRVTPKSHVWLDRSKLKLPNLEGGPADLQPGRKIEVKFENPVLRQVADWIKVEVVQPPQP